MVDYSFINLEKIARKTIIKDLLDLGYLDGASLDEETLHNTNDMIFWEDVLTKAEAQNKAFYLVFSIDSINYITYADNKPKIANLVLNIDIFTTEDISSKKVYKMREEFENKFIENNNYFNLSLLGKFFDAEVNMNHFSYMVRKEVTF